MRGGLILVLAGALWAQTPPEPIEVLTRARDKIVANRPRVPNYTCTQTVDRLYLRRAKEPVPFPSCAELHAQRDSKAFPLALFLTDRLRLDAKVSGGVEIGAWVGARQFDEKSIFDLVGTGPFGTGTLGPFLTDIFDNSGTRFAYNGKVLSDAGELYQYSFQIPTSASHYLVHAGRDWQAVAYEGEVGIDPRSLDLRRLVVHTASLPLESRACEVSTLAEYAMVHLSRGDFLLPQQSRLHIVAISTAEDYIATTYTGCREYQSESTISFGGDTPAAAGINGGEARPVSLPEGLPISLALAEPIDTNVAAAGDLVVETVRKAVRAKGSKSVLIPAGAMVRGRILKMQHWRLRPVHFEIAIRLEDWEAGGVTSPLYATPDRSVGFKRASTPGRGVLVEMPPEGQAGRIKNYAIETDQKAYIVPRGFESRWITMKPPQESDSAPQTEKR